MEKKTMTVKELADQMGIALPSAYALTNTKDFPCIIIGKRRKLIPVAAFEEWLKRAAEKPAS